MKIRGAAFRIVREPLKAAYGFKGGALHELWQSLVRLKSEDGNTGIGIGVQSVLWSDPAVYALYGEEDGNRLMSSITRHAAFASTGREAADPIALTKMLAQEALRYGRERIHPELSASFALNALVPVDLAAWQLYGRASGAGSFDELLPKGMRGALGHRQERLAIAPAIGYGMPSEEIARLLAEGYAVLKLKLGADPNGDGDKVAMLAWDQARLTAVHELAQGRRTDLTDSGRVAYYLDLNGRYDTMDRVLSLLDHADRIGALDQVLLLEEPFPVTDRQEVGRLPVRVVADESVHGEEEAVQRISDGYGAIALKPVAKTLSVSLAVAREAHLRGIPSFCADLTAGPLLLEWNKTVASRLEALPGLTAGLIEVNGPEHYADWPRLGSYHPRWGASWTVPREGRYELPAEYFAGSGGIFETAAAYEAMVQGQSLSGAGGSV
ncbi:hypothetical protein J31TS4_14110 [Paenibacillus sp. J31TS4]|uniref:enolase C-terminal domain-like protein n=1 Tax=Paenibacillus sp. J31TS4 TaxID=2807195 RepID=UPI001B15E4B0|nr:enolase C-terminal domain-like protein [Paenibacillus sp. J31TS4]GIP38131.1 hypothetical protein J31TS4_14110 [Paenibacillus sp. J31TS4]